MLQRDICMTLNLSSDILLDAANSSQSQARYHSLHSVIHLTSKINRPEIIASQLNSNGRPAPKHIEPYIINHTSVCQLCSKHTAALSTTNFPKRRNTKNIFAFPDQSPQSSLLWRVKILSPQLWNNGRKSQRAAEHAGEAWKAEGHGPDVVLQAGHGQLTQRSKLWN